MIFAQPKPSCFVVFYFFLGCFTKQFEWTLFSEDDDQDEASRLCNMTMLCGPPGVGKTSAVYG